MVTKKLFALASVTALTGLMATVAASGCSSTTVEAAGTGTDSATNSETKAPKPDTGVKPGDNEEPPASTACKGMVAVDLTTLPWKKAYSMPGSCTEKELADLVTFLDANNMAKYADWKKSVAGATCSACMFGKESETTWKPLLEDAKGQLVELNVGGCIEIARVTEGAAVKDAEACGKIYQNWFDCRFEACNDCPDGDTAALQKCLSAASKQACKKAFDDVGTICTDTGIGDAETACNGDKFVFEGPIRAQCINGLAGEGG